MRKLYKKIENWLWVILLIASSIYFKRLVGSFHTENEVLKGYQKQFSQEIEEKYQKNKQLQAEIQAQFNEATQNLLKTLQSLDPKSY